MVGSYLGLFLFELNFQKFLQKSVRYNVMPMGIKTTIPAIKLFLILANIDFFMFLFCINLRIA